MAALHVLEDRNGRITPERLVTAARPTGHIMHGDFEWNDKKAGHKFRIEQAREIIRTWVMPKVTTSVIEFRAPAYVRDPRLPGSTQGYISTVRVRSDEDLKREVLVREFQYAASALQRAYDLADAFKARDQVQGLISQINAIRQRVETPLPSGKRV